MFAGGSASLQKSCATARVDVDDINSKIWTTAQLSEPRLSAAATVLGGDKIFFGGSIIPESLGSVCGIWNFIHNRSAAVDIYDASANTWAIAKLGRARYPTAAATANKVFFAGGEATFPVFFNKAFDAYDAGTNIWSDTLLRNTGPLRTPLAVGSKIYYAGGIYDGNIGNWPEVRGKFNF